jgi:hypothetical protein
MTTQTVQSDRTSGTPAERLQATMAAVRVTFTWFGIRKTLTSSQKAQAAETFGAEEDCLAASKKLLDTRAEAYKAVTAIRNRIRALWWGMSLPYPDPGVRLIRQDQVDRFNDEMNRMRQELAEAVGRLDAQLPALKQAARQRLGSLYDLADYPSSLVGLFAVDWDFPSVEPPSYLMQLNPELYEQERRRMVARFEEAVRMAEEAFTVEFRKLVSHLVERLAGQEDGKPKVFRDSAVENIREFFERFRMLNVRSNADLEDLVQTAQRALKGASPQGLRDDGDLRTRIASQLAAVQASLDGLLVDQPRRRVLRPTRTESQP